MEAALGIIGAVGVVGQIFDGCMKAYRIFTTAANQGRDSERLVCKIRIEEARLGVWGREWGVVEGKLEANLAAADWGPPGLYTLAETILSQLYSTIMDFNKLQDRYGLREATPGSVDREAYKNSEDPRSSVAARLRDGLTLRARWVVVDKEKFEVLLEDLGYYNDRLEKLFPPERISTFQRTWTNELLDATQRNVQNLDLLENASSGKYPRLNALAKLKHLRINLDAQAPSKKILSTSELKVPRWRLTFDGATDSARIHGVYQRPTDALKNGQVSEEIPVLIDFISYEHYQDMDTRLHLYQRVDNLARMLHSASNRHPDLHTLDCLGYVDDTAASRYGIIHMLPESIPKSPASPSFLSLSTVMDDNTRRTPDLDARFRLAHSLAIALWSFHSLDWLHKAFYPSNILFFPPPPAESGSTPSHHNLDHPFVLGFDSSRPEHLSEMSAAAQPSPAHLPDLYRHPDSLGIWRQSYRKAYDIYSLGLVLLEIGLWSKITGYWKQKYSSAVFKQRLLSGIVPHVGSKAGSKYRTVVERCLKYGDAPDSQESNGNEKEGETKNETTIPPNQMMEWVVMSLEKLSV
ncbi:hypothetical protein EV356DRAFT_300462 [Viridothelium virens]|uniref:Protein kinase domain-containing protein n=1 Tax=Viridothelium virens TaxID=1048519 RepID=A0A6A6HJR1_VIRVR|nr:hypothetical protein EV356DRAFT_300462 [Viridothelium virens]